MNFSFGTTKPATEFTLPAASTPATTVAGFQLNPAAAGDAGKQNKPATNLFGTPGANPPSFGFGSNAPKSTPSTQTLNFGSITSASTATVAPTLSLGTTAVSSAAPPTFGLLTSTASTTASFTPILGTTTSTSLSLGSAAPTSAASKPAATLSFGLATSTAATSAPTLTLGTTLGSTLGTTLGTTSLPTTSTSTAISTVPATGTLSFGQLEDSINKWTIDLEEQGKFFINQAKQLNAWDSLLISNGEKILNLNSGIERVKSQQIQLDQELDFVLAQQKELEELILPLEKELTDIPVSDIDRNQMYQLSEIIDSQLKQMSDDLKEIIEHINETHKDDEVANPVTQISRILNAHMNSLQWIDRNTTQISGNLEQITKMQDMNRRNFSLNQSLNNY